MAQLSFLWGYNSIEHAPQYIMFMYLCVELAAITCRINKKHSTGRDPKRSVIICQMYKPLVSINNVVCTCVCNKLPQCILYNWAKNWTGL